MFDAVSFFIVVMVSVPTIFAFTAFTGPGFASFIRHRLSILFGFLPERKDVWGTVYDSDTKRPIPFVNVQLLDSNLRVLETRITDENGRYGFLTASASLIGHNIHVSIKSTISGYVFPSKIPATVDAFIYDHPYYGGDLLVGDNMLVNADIPMDPIKPSRRPLIVKAPSLALRTTIAALADAGLWIGAVIVPLNVVFLPNPFTFGLLFLFLGTVSLRLFGIRQKPFGLVLDRASSKPVTFALVTLYNEKGHRQAFAVSDERGRYFISLRSGKYSLKARTPADVNPSREVSEQVMVSNGWLTREIML